MIGLRRGQGRRPDRNAPAALARRRAEGPRPRDRRRGAALRRRQKELLRQLRLNVDVLSLSATPIPRTLQMSLAGLRDISVIETPPEGRRPIHTYVGEYDDDLVKTAIERELGRGGQVFFLHDRVETIDEAAERDARAGARGARRGRARPDGRVEARETMIDFLRGEVDVLVSTTIIESGLDIPQANTLIVERADRLGLAQLYQIRGRVGRSRERAYAYLLYPSAEALSGDARRGWRRCPTTRSSGRASRSRCATSRSAAPATCSAPSSPVTSRPSGSSSTARCWTRRFTGAHRGCRRRGKERGVGAGAARRPGGRVHPRRLHPLRGGEDRRPPADRGRREPAELADPRSSRTASAPAGAGREPDRAPGGAHQARPSRGALVEFRAGRLVVAPARARLDQARALREQAEAVYESLKKTLRVPVPDDARAVPRRFARSRRLVGSPSRRCPAAA